MPGPEEPKGAESVDAMAARLARSHKGADPETLRKWDEQGLLNVPVDALVLVNEDGEMETGLRALDRSDPDANHAVMVQAAQAAARKRQAEGQ